MPYFHSQVPSLGILSASAFSPTDIAGIQAWYRADLGVTGSSPVTAWADQSGNARDLSEGTNGPTLSSAAVNGQDAITFDGTNDKLATADFTLAMPYHWFVVMKNVSWTDTEIAVYGDNDAASANPPQLEQRGTGSGIAQRVNNTDSVGVALGTTNYGVIDAFFNTGSSASYRRLNNGTPVTSTFTAASMDGLVLGARFSDRFANVSIAEFIIYNAEVTGADLTNLMAYFTDRYGIP